MKTKTDSIPYNLSVSALIPLTDTPSSREEGRGGGASRHSTCTCTWNMQRFVLPDRQFAQNTVNPTKLMYTLGCPRGPPPKIIRIRRQANQIFFTAYNVRNFYLSRITVNFEISGQKYLPIRCEKTNQWLRVISGSICGLFVSNDLQCDWLSHNKHYSPKLHHVSKVFRLWE